MPAGVDVMLPLPVPAVVTVSGKRRRVNCAVTPRASVTVVVHGSVPLQPPPDQPAKVEPVAGVAVRVTVVPDGNMPAHVVPQSMTGGSEVTVPLPLPERVMTTVLSSANDALTVVSSPTPSSSRALATAAAP